MPARALGVALVALLASTLLGAGPAAGPAAAAVPPTPGSRLTGGDLSWPNCPKGMGIPSRRSPGNPLPLASATFAVIGLTNGPGWYPNPCLAAHVAWAKARGLWTSAYSMTTFPTAGQLRTYGGSGPWAADHAGGPAAQRRLPAGGLQRGVDAGGRSGVPFVWVDVEPYPTHPWSRDVLANRQVVRGVVRAYEDAGYRVGFYSYDGGWRAVVGAWRKPAYPAWVPVGPVARGLAVATARCARPSFSGGPVLLAQWVQDSRDRDVTCVRLTGLAPRPHPLTALLGASWGPGASGPAVATLQRGLNMRPSHVTGRFDAQTRRVVLAFQVSRAFPLTGVATDLELRALGAGSTLPGTPNRLRPLLHAVLTGSHRQRRRSVQVSFATPRCARHAGRGRRVGTRPTSQTITAGCPRLGRSADHGSRRLAGPRGPCCGLPPRPADAPPSRATPRPVRPEVQRGRSGDLEVESLEGLLAHVVGRVLLQVPVVPAVVLADGRRLGVQQVGARDELAVLVHHDRVDQRHRQPGLDDPDVAQPALRPDSARPSTERHRDARRRRSTLDAGHPRQRLGQALPGRQPGPDGGVSGDQAFLRAEEAHHVQAAAAAAVIASAPSCSTTSTAISVLAVDRQARVAAHPAHRSGADRHGRSVRTAGRCGRQAP